MIWVYFNNRAGHWPHLYILSDTFTYFRRNWNGSWHRWSALLRNTTCPICYKYLNAYIAVVVNNRNRSRCTCVETVATCSRTLTLARNTLVAVFGRMPSLASHMYMHSTEWRTRLDWSILHTFRLGSNSLEPTTCWGRVAPIYPPTTT